MKSREGFTLIELVVVLTLIGIIVGLGLPQYKNAVRRGREAALQQNLFTMRTLIQQYYTDKKQYPTSLQTLVDEQYMNRIPEDPITKSADTWEVVFETLSENDIFSGVIPGISDVKSGSDQKALDGTAYNTW